MAEPLVITVILNTNRRADTLSCLASLERSHYANHRVVVLDNASSDGSVAAIHEMFAAVEVVSLEENRGYAGNNNVGIVAAMERGADWIFVLNEDTIVEADCLTHLVAAGESDRRIGIVGPTVYHHDAPEVIQSAGGVLDRFWISRHLHENERDEGQLKGLPAVDWISGCALLVRREVVEEVGALDARFFYYWEETEWCLRARRAGWEIRHVPEARLWHKGVQRDYAPNPSVTYYNTRNRFLMLAKHKAPPLVWLAAWADTLRTLTSWTVKPRWRPMRFHRDAMWQGTWDFLRRRWGMRAG
ncbi:MAG: glycosyltransferase family 2 protein [Anaerolineae bacterium]|nr:glycosyltransferase family 2 protein [Anaerolineae bacterium]